MLTGDLVQVDPTILVPHWSPADLLRVAGYFVLTAWLPGACLCRLAGWRLAGRAERWALTAVVGTLWTSLAYYLLGLGGAQRWHLWPTGLPVLLAAVAWLTRRWQVRASQDRWKVWTRPQPRCSRWELAALGLTLALAVWHVVRVDAAVVYDQQGLRLYGVWYSDKLVTISSAPALMHEVPPRSLRMAGWPFPYHFFPHVFVAAAARDTGVDFVNIFWFHAAALGAVIAALAAVGFARRMTGSYALGCLGLAFFGLTFCSPKMRPLDLSLPLALLGMGAIDRWRCGRRLRWAVLAVALLGATPGYELFHALGTLAGLGLWWTATVLGPLVRPWVGSLTRRQPSGAEAEPWPRAWLRPTLLVGCTFAAALGSVKLTMLGAPVVGHTTFVVKSSYRDLFKHRCQQAIDQKGPGSAWLATLLAWRQGHASPATPGASPGKPPAAWQRIAAEAAFDVGLAGYVLIGFVNVGLAGLLTLIAWRWPRPPPPPPPPSRWAASHGLTAAIVVFGFLLPAIVTWGHWAGGEFSEKLEFWETPNIYRPLNLGWYLLALLSPPAIVAAARRIISRPRSWATVGRAVVLALAAGEAVVLLRAAVAPEKSFEIISRDRLGALAFLRTQVPFGDVVLHPWSDEQVYNVDAPDHVAWIYKRHFTAGSGLAGQRMWYEGKEDHLFIGGFIRAEDVYHRRRVRQQFYAGSPPQAVVQEVLDTGQVRWVVADVDHLAPPLVRNTWPPVWTSPTVTIYHTPSQAVRRQLLPSPLAGEGPGVRERSRPNTN